MRWAICTLFCAALVAGCGDTDGSISDDTSAPPPSDEAMTDEGQSGGIVFRVTQTESGCTLTGPTEVPVDETYRVIVKNSTAGPLDLYVSLLADGHTYEEFVALQPLPGAYFPRPSFIQYAASQPLGASDVDAVADDESLHAYSSEPGPHAVYTWGSEEALWLCGSFTAT